jgi:hypothetical protein
VTSVGDERSSTLRDLADAALPAGDDMARKIRLTKATTAGRSIQRGSLLMWHLGRYKDDGRYSEEVGVVPSNGFGCSGYISAGPGQPSTARHRCNYRLAGDFAQCIIGRKATSSSLQEIVTAVIHG